MTRIERRKLERKFGLDVQKKSLPRNQQWEMIRQNIIAGKKKQGEEKETVRVQENAAKDQANSAQVASLATTYMVKDGLSYIEALEKAKLSLSTK